jgi:hypothetical protein
LWDKKFNKKTTSQPLTMERGNQKEEQGIE